MALIRCDTTELSNFSKDLRLRHFDVRVSKTDLTSEASRGIITGNLTQETIHFSALGGSINGTASVTHSGFAEARRANDRGQMLATGAETTTSIKVFFHERIYDMLRERLQASGWNEDRYKRQLTELHDLMNTLTETLQRSGAGANGVVGTAYAHVFNAIDDLIENTKSIEHVRDMTTRYRNAAPISPQVIAKAKASVNNRQFAEASTRPQSEVPPRRNEYLREASPQETYQRPQEPTRRPEPVRQQETYQRPQESTRRPEPVRQQETYQRPQESSSVPPRQHRPVQSYQMDGNLIDLGPYNDVVLPHPKEYRMTPERDDCFRSSY
jgi:hypothetical protein